MIGVIALFWLFTLLMPTDRKQIESNLWAMGRAVLDQKPDDLVKHWSKDFRYDEMSRGDLARAVGLTVRKQAPFGPK